MSAAGKEGQWKVLLADADDVFRQGDYESALMLYHQGDRLHPQLNKFRAGISRCEEAIAKSIDSGLRKAKKKLKKTANNSLLSLDSSTVSSHATSRHDIDRKQLAEDVQHFNNLETDRKFLASLAKQIDPHPIHGISLHETLRREQEYVSECAEFWRRHLPARRTAVKMPKKPRENTGFLEKHVYNEMMAAMADFRQGHHHACLERSIKCLSTIKRSASSPESVLLKSEVVSLHGYVGMACFEMSEYEDSQAWHEKELEQARSLDSKQLLSRALENLGRLYAHTGRPDRALLAWEEKLPLCTEDAELAWLHQEIASCHFYLHTAHNALQSARLSYAHAQICGDLHWQLSAKVLIGQSLVMQGLSSEALEAFDQAIDIVKLKGDPEAEASIKQLRDDISQQNGKEHKDIDSVGDK